MIMMKAVSLTSSLQRQQHRRCQEELRQLEVIEKWEDPRRTITLSSMDSLSK